MLVSSDGPVCLAGVALIAPVDAAIEGPCDRAAPAAERLPALLGAELVHRVALGGEHDAIGLARGHERDLAILHVGEHLPRVALERVTVAGATCDVLPELVARMEHDHLLGGQLFPPAVAAEDEGA